MATKARWFFVEPVAAAQPLTPDEGLRKIEEVGQPIDLRGSEARLRFELHATISREGELDAAGISCDLKGKPDMTCGACPLRGSDARAPLCKVGAQQETILARLLVAQSAT